jgi:DNA processing protein
MDTEDLLTLIAFRRIELSSLSFFKLLEYFKNLSELRKIKNKEEVFICLGFSKRRCQQILAALKGFASKDNQEILEVCRKKNIRLLSFKDKDYPLLLSNIPDKPYLLFARGNLKKDRPLLSVVGARDMSSYAKAIMDDLLKPLIESGVGIVSGLAYGVDSLAHKIALFHKGYTIAVLGSGLLNIYPSEHQYLAEEIFKADGLLLSEYLPNSKPYKHYFPQRNRIIAGISQALLVVEAGLHSGTKITARLALEYNREILAVPGNINQPNSFGTNNLLKEGAFPATQAEDIANILGIDLEKSSSQRVKISSLPKEAQKILQNLAKSPAPLDKLAVEMELSLSEALILISELELLGLIYKDALGYYYLK